MSWLSHVLHQTWRTTAIPDRFGRYAASWRDHNARLDARCHDDAACRQAMVDYEPRLLRLYDRLPHYMMRVDLVRYVWMLHLGGVYADLDVECTAPISALLEPGVHLVLEDIRPGTTTIGNALMSSSPGEPYWAHVLEVAARRAERLHHFAAAGPARQRLMVLRTTGPYMLTDAWSTWGGAPPTVHAQGTVGAVHHGAGTWWRAEA